jgi:hypothetical protein
MLEDKKPELKKLRLLTRAEFFRELGVLYATVCVAVLASAAFSSSSSTLNSGYWPQLLGMMIWPVFFLFHAFRCLLICAREHLRVGGVYHPHTREVED